MNSINVWTCILNSLGQEVVLDVDRRRKGVDLRIDIVLEPALARIEFGADLLDFGLVGSGAELDLEVCAQPVLRLRHEIRANVVPRGRIGRLDYQFRVREIAHLDLRLDLLFDERQDRLVQIGANLDL